MKSGKSAGGVLVAGVVEGSPADRAGIKAGDIVTRFGGREVNAELPEHLPLINQLVFATPVGETVEVDLSPRRRRRCRQGDDGTASTGAGRTQGD